MGDASKFFEQNILGLSDPEKYNLYGGLSEMSDELSVLRDQMNKLSEKSDELSVLRDQMNKLSEKSDELSVLHDQMNKLSEKSDELSVLHDQMNKLSEKSDELSVLHDQMNKLSEKSDELSVLRDQMNRLEAALGKIGRDMQELRKSLRVPRAAPKLRELRIKSKRRQPAADVQSSAPSVITKGEHRSNQRVLSE